VEVFEDGEDSGEEFFEGERGKWGFAGTSAGGVEMG